MYFTSIKSGSISFILIWCLALPCAGQVVLQERYELLLLDELGMANPQVTSLGTDGILVHTRIRERTTDRLQLVMLDTALRESWQGVITLDKNQTIARVVAHDHRVYLLLRAITFGNFDFTIIVIDIRSRSYDTYLVNNLIPLTPSDFNISTNAILIGGYFNESPVVLHYSLATGRSRLLPGFFTDPGHINQIKTYDDGLIDIIVSMRNQLRKEILLIRSYTPEGDLINATALEGEIDKKLLYGNSIRKEDGTQIIAGSFGARNPEYSRGVFFAELNAEEKPTVRYYNFSDFENYFKYMKPRREARVKERIARRKLKGKKNRQSSMFLTQELFQAGDEYLLLGEAFYPRYLYLNTFGNSGRGDRIFDGYRYTHAAVVAFDESGAMQWDNAFEINDVKTFDLKQYVKLVPGSDKIEMLYLHENNLNSKTINRNQVLEGKSTIELRAKSNTGPQKEKKTEAGELEYWYNPYFFAYGIQSINNTHDENDDSGRKVLFINKLKFQ